MGGWDQVRVAVSGLHPRLTISDRGRTKPWHPLVMHITRIITLAISAAALLVGCRLSSARPPTDSSRMVDAVLRGFAAHDPPGRRACRGRGGRRYADTGQVPCSRAPFVLTRLVGFTPDSLGACVWIIQEIPVGVRHFDGGAFGVPVTRAGEFRRDAFLRGDCERSTRDRR